MTGTAPVVVAPNLAKYRDWLRDLSPIECQGNVVQVVGLTIEAQGLNSQIGELCEIRPDRSQQPMVAEVVGFKDESTLLMPLGEMQGLRPGSPVVASGRLFSVPVGSGLLGRVVDGLGRPIDGKAPVCGGRAYPLAPHAPHPLDGFPSASLWVPACGRSTAC